MKLQLNQEITQILTMQSNNQDPALTIQQEVCPQMTAHGHCPITKHEGGCS